MSSHDYAEVLGHWEGYCRSAMSPQMQPTRGTGCQYRGITPDVDHYHLAKMMSSRKLRCKFTISLCNYYVFGDRHSETMQISYLDLNFCVRLFKTWSSVGMRLKPLKSLKRPPSSKERSFRVILQACLEGLQFPFRLPPPPRNCSYCFISLVNIPKKMLVTFI